MSSGKGIQERGGFVGSAHAETADLYRRVNNLIRIGKIIDADYESRRVRVQIGQDDDRTLVTNWLRYLSESAGYDRHTKIPELGEQVLMVCPSGRVESAIIIGSLGYTDRPDAASDPNHDVKLMRVLEDTDYWTAKEERLAVGDVNPNEKKQNLDEPLATIPPQEKTLKPEREIAEILEYYYRNIIRPEIKGLIQHVVATTQPDSEAILQLVSNSLDSGIARFLIEAGITGKGDAVGTINVHNGKSSFSTETNPNKSNNPQPSGDAKLYTDVDATNAEGDAIHSETISADNGKAAKNIVIEGDNKSELTIILKNAPNFRLTIGKKGQYIQGNGEVLTLFSPDTLNLLSNGTVRIQGADVSVAGDSSVSVTGGSINATGNSVGISGGSVDLNGGVKINGTTQVKD